MSLRKLQEDIATWSSYNFGPDVTTMQSIVGLPEEVGELCRAVLKKYQGIRGTAEEWDAEIEKEIGDVLIKLCEFANRAGVDIEDAVFKRWAVVGMRNFVDNPIAHGLPSESE